MNTEKQMQKAMESLDNRLLNIRAGRANPGMVSGIMVSYYGALTPLQSLANITVPEARQLMIKPFDRGILKDIEHAIHEANIGITPTNNGEMIILTVPELTEDRRKELAKDIKKKGDNAKVAIRNIRRDANDAIKKENKAGDISDDEAKNSEDEIQKITDKYIAMIDSAIDDKTKEIITV